MRVGRALEPGLQRALRPICRVLNVHVQLAARTGVVHKLPADNVELARPTRRVEIGVGSGSGGLRLEI